MLSYFRRHLAWKIFLSYLVVVLAGAFVLAVTARLAVPSAFQRHLGQMGGMMGRGPGPGGPMMEESLFPNFRAAFNEAIGWAALAATSVAVMASVLIARRIVAPVRDMASAAERIAEGHYGERVVVDGAKATEAHDELDQLGLSFNRMAEKLEKTEARRTELIGNVAHELRTPLTTIKGSLEGLIDGVLPANAETFYQIHHEAERLERLATDLQELSRIEAGAIELQLAPQDVAGLIDAAMTRLKRQYEEKGVHLEVSLPQGLPQVTADEDRIAQVLLNLLGNSLQYTPSGGLVRVEARKIDMEVEISVTDTGIGIPPDRLPYLFDRFYRVDSSRSRVGGGSGIGLTIAKHVVEAHGGRIRAASPGLGRGSTFSFTLPTTI